MAADGFGEGGHGDAARLKALNKKLCVVAYLAQINLNPWCGHDAAVTGFCCNLGKARTTMRRRSFAGRSNASVMGSPSLFD